MPFLEQTRESLLARVAERKRKGQCVSCGSPTPTSQLACDCSFCIVCVRRGDQTHEGPLAIPCPDRA
jgi:hypothetical protein